ncbi:MAG: TonB-dependent receptor [Flavobacteriales bacterium]|nr:TonB-dependent receptor [Flavobacteriales bacterium]|tara:strand:+ start:4188 stop:6611 length:2424 start_codon:yes stop_codon:yes gene_type:complete
MKLEAFKYFFLLLLFTSVSAQNTITGIITSEENQVLENVKIFNSLGELIDATDASGLYKYSTQFDSIMISFFKEGYLLIKKEFVFNKSNLLEENIKLQLVNRNLKEVSVVEPKINEFEIDYLSGVNSNTIFTAKKNEIIILNNKGGQSINNSRQIYNKTVSLNIIKTDDVGLQLNIGGRGLNPRRTSNFNVRQNNYDITPDPLGYPESYYTPPFEALENIVLIRGAASLQYGTQFGGLINFNFKKPIKSKTLEFTSRNTLGSFNLFTNFTSLSGTKNNLGYYIFFNHKKGDGFRSNSNFKSNNLYSFFSYKFNSHLNMSIEFTYLNYLAQQPGGLTDNMFNQNIFQSNRERNWFEVDWKLYNFQLSYKFSKSTSIYFSNYILDAHRFSIGFRSNRVDQIDSFEERDLIKSTFNNIGFESKLIHHFTAFKRNMTFLLGAKIFNGSNSSEQGPGSSGVDADFNLYSNMYPNYHSQSNYSNPNWNYSLFSEQIISLNDKMYLTPGFRLEYIKTSSDGYFREINTDAAENVIMNNIIYTNQDRERYFLLIGLGYSYNVLPWIEFYANCSQNYRAVTFADINTVNPSFIINPNIKDEDGYTFDFGYRGNYLNFISFDFSGFFLFYNNRIGFIQKEVNGLVKNEKGNIGNAQIIGNESLINFNLDQLFNINSDFNFNFYINLSLLSSKYTESQLNGVEGNELEYVPEINLKTGVQIGNHNIKADLQYTYMSNQYTDATNSIDGDLSGIIGQIPKYDIVDFSIIYLINKNFKIESGINNIFDSHYFTTRATGYPGPGIIPSPSRNYYLTLECKF